MATEGNKGKSENEAATFVSEEEGSEKVTNNNECMDEEENDEGKEESSGEMDVSSEVTEGEPTESEGLPREHEVPGESESQKTAQQPEPQNTSEQPKESEELPSVSDDKEKRDNEQKRQCRSPERGALMQQLADLDLPDGIIMIKDRKHTSYHCKYCNRVLKSLPTMRAHVGGKCHKQKLHMKMLTEKRRNFVRRNFAKPSKYSGRHNQNVTPKELMMSYLENSIIPKEPLKSSLEDFLSSTKAGIIGLSYIIEIQSPNQDPTFQCNLCELSYDSSEIKAHILGIKHFLMYSKLVEPGKLTELLAKKLTKAEKNKEIAKLSEELERKHGRGKVTVKFLPAQSPAVGTWKK